MAAHYYFAFDTRMGLAEMKRACRAPKRIGTARLDGWRLAFTHSSPTGNGLPDMIELGSAFDTEARDVPGLDRVQGQPQLSPVWGVLWELDQKDRLALDKYVGFLPTGGPENNVFSASAVTVLVPGRITRRIAAYSYVVRRKANHIAPASDYMRQLMEAAFEAALPSAYTGQLAKVGRGQTG